MSPLLVVGLVQRPHGLAGEVSVRVLTDFPERFAPGSTLTWRRGDEQRPLRLAGARPHGDRLLLSFDSVGDVDAARGLQGGELCVAEADAFPAPEGFFYSHEVRGWACEDAAGRRLGVATGLEQTPAGPLLSVEVRPGKEALVPFVHPIVSRVDREAGKIILDPPEGLMEL
ncbi:MAG: ribosome maturation factor RimM [Thermoanaerobaculia bacterium]